jgi:outer membrane lipoprotein-sorting protein
MTRRVRNLTLVTAWVAWAALGAVSQGTEILDAVRASSESLIAYSATIQMTRHEARGDSVIAFSFDFVPPDRMHIVYTEPAAVEGQTLILNGERFYTYIPSLNRRIWQDVDDDSNDQGEEMGFLYDFVIRGAAVFIETHPVETSEGASSYVLEATGTAIDVAELVFQTDGGKQVVWVSRADAVPVAVDIYSGDDLTMELRVFDYRVNEPIDESLFLIPEKT